MKQQLNELINLFYRIFEITVRIVIYIVITGSFNFIIMILFNRYDIAEIIFKYVVGFPIVIFAFEILLICCLKSLNFMLFGEWDDDDFRF